MISFKSPLSAAPQNSSQSWIFRLNREPGSISFGFWVRSAEKRNPPAVPSIRQKISIELPSLRILSKLKQGRNDVRYSNRRLCITALLMPEPPAKKRTPVKLCEPSAYHSVTQPIKDRNTLKTSAHPFFGCVTSFIWSGSSRLDVQRSIFIMCRKSKTSLLLLQISSLKIKRYFK